MNYSDLQMLSEAYTEMYEAEDIDEATAMVKRGHAEGPIRQKIGGSENTVRSKALQHPDLSRNLMRLNLDHEFNRGKRKNLGGKSRFKEPGKYEQMKRDKDEQKKHNESEERHRRNQSDYSSTEPSGWGHQKEQFDVYDLVLSHLLDEGYADDVNSAESIMVNMSEEWRNEIVQEKYYAPDEKLPSGKTPVEKSSEALIRKDAKSKNFIKHVKRHITNVLHGADNPDYNFARHKDVEITGDPKDVMRIRHPDSNVRFAVRKTGKKIDGRPVHEITWGHDNWNSLDDVERKRILHSAKHVWKNHVEPRLPHGSVIRNFPISNRANRNARARLYSRIGGFGKQDMNTGYQYAGVDRPPSPRQRAKGKKRTFPMNSNTQTVYDS